MIGLKQGSSRISTEIPFEFESNYDRIETVLYLLNLQLQYVFESNYDRIETYSLLRV